MKKGVLPSDFITSYPSLDVFYKVGNPLKKNMTVGGIGVGSNTNSNSQCF